MIRIPIGFHKYLMQGKVPVTYCQIATHLASRIYSDRELQGVFSASALLADGSVLADGSEIAGYGSASAGEKAARVIDFGSFERTISPQSSDLLASFSGKQKQHIAVKLDNSDYYFTRLIAKEPFLSRKLFLFVGFEDHPQSDHYSIFAGTISEISVDKDSMTLGAEEA